MAESNRDGLSSRECNLLDLQSEKEEEEISTYLNSLDRADLLLIRDTYFLFCGGESKQEKAISKILEERGIKPGQVS